MSPSPDSRPAILGGEPLRPNGPPDWPPDDPALRDVLHRAAAERTWGKYHGPFCDALREQIAAWHDSAEVLLCCSGTAAVELALRGLNVGPGEEVILAAYDFKGNFQDILAIGATPVLVDLLPGNWNLDPAALDAAITEKTRAILVSHLHGGIVEMPAVREIADRRGVPIVEDACQMPGARIHGRVAGDWGDVAVHSFGGSKLLSAGRGGAVVTPRAEVAQRIRLYTQRGNDAYPLSELQAALLLPQLAALPARNALRLENAARLSRLLKDRCPGLRPLRNAPSDSQPGYYKFGLQYEPNDFGELPRELFARAVRAEGIAIDPGFRALHQIHSRRRFRAPAPLPQADAADRGILTLHHPVLLESADAIETIVRAVERIRHWSAALLAEPV